MGMRKVLERSSSLVILLEWEYLENPQHNEEKTRAMLKWMEDAGYRWYRYSHPQDSCHLGKISELTI